MKQSEIVQVSLAVLDSSIASGNKISVYDARSYAKELLREMKPKEAIKFVKNNANQESNT